MASTLLMFDDTNPALLPAGYDAYAGYINGNWPDFRAIVAKFPKANVLSIDVNGTNTSADALDIEPGDASNLVAVGWVRAKMSARAKLIVLYTSVSNVSALAAELSSAGITRASYKLWSAHYGAGAHICGPATCKLCDYACDGTQFSSTAFGQSLDESLIESDFFSAVSPAPSPSLSNPLLVENDTGDAVRQLQTRLNAWGYKLVVDGDFGPETLSAVTGFQSKHKLTVDGVVGPETWAALNAAPPETPAAPKPYPAPAHLGGDFTKYALCWDAVTVDGKKISSYQLKVVQLNGKVVVNSTVTGTSAVLSKLVPTWHYKVYVSALGGPGTPGTASTEIIA